MREKVQNLVCKLSRLELYYINPTGLQSSQTYTKGYYSDSLGHFSLSQRLS